LTPAPEAARLANRTAIAVGREEQAMPDRVSTRPATGAMLAAGLVLATSLASAGCATVQLQAPKEPITINLNVKIDQEVRYRLDKDLEDAIAANPDLF
jgi:hypothetical protein